MTPWPIARKSVAAGPIAVYVKQLSNVRDRNAGSDAAGAIRWEGIRVPALASRVATQESGDGAPSYRTSRATERPPTEPVGRRSALLQNEPPAGFIGQPFFTINQ